MRRDLTILAALVLPIGGALWWWSGAPDDTAPGSIVVAAPAPAASPVTAAAPANAPLQALPTVTLLETETPDDTSPGAATIRYADGYIRHLAVGDALDRYARLTAVTDTSAIFRTNGRSVSLTVAAAAASGGGELAGIDFDAHPTAANPAMARP